jgi:opacity protein-like surface antigen
MFYRNARIWPERDIFTPRFNQLSMNIKRLLLILLTVSAAPALAQSIKLTPFGGYTIQDRVYGYYGDMTISDGAHYGLNLSYEKSSSLAVDLLYSHQDCKFNIYDYSIGPGNTSGKIDGSVSYLMLGSRHSPDFNAKLSPYGGVLVGAAIFKSTYTSEAWKFAVGMRLGAVYHVSDRIGIMVQTQLMIPVQGVGIYFGTGGAGAGTSSSATQLGFTGGVEVKLR